MIRRWLPRLGAGLILLWFTLAWAPPMPDRATWPIAGTPFAAGMAHIATGADHLLFLFVLLLATVRRRAPLASACAIAAAFTLGHAASLMPGSNGWPHAPAHVLEAGAAAAILAAALHAWRPLRVPVEPVLALVFGLVHGLAFASSLSGAGLEAQTIAQAQFAFDLGIDAMQLIVLAAVLPPLLVLGAAQPQLFERLRRTVTPLAALLACGWIADRLHLADLSDYAWLADSAAPALLLPAGAWLLTLQQNTQPLHVP